MAQSPVVFLVIIVLYSCFHNVSTGSESPSHSSHSDSVTSVSSGSSSSTSSSSTSYIQGYCEKCVLEAGAGYYRVPGYCNIFAHCSTSSQDLETCPPGTFFDGTRCRHAADVNCEDDICRKRPDGYAYSDGVYCYGYYLCQGGRSVYNKCRKGESFSGVSCTEDTSCKQYSWLEYGSGCPKQFSPCPGDTSKFYIEGAGGVQHTMYCPKGLNFNPSTCVCDWGFHPPTYKCSPLFNFKFNGNTLDEYNRATLTICGAVSPSYKKALFEDNGHAIVWMMDGLDLGSKFVLSFDFQYLGSDKGEVALMGNDYKDDVSFTLKLTYDSQTEEVVARLWLADDTKLIMAVQGVALYLKHRVYLAKNKDIITLQVDDITPSIEKYAAGVKVKNTPLVIGETAGCIGFAGFMDNIRLSRCADDVVNPQHQFDKK